MPTGQDGMGDERRRRWCADPPTHVPQRWTGRARRQRWAGCCRPVTWRFHAPAEFAAARIPPCWPCGGLGGRIPGSARRPRLASGSPSSRSRHHWSCGPCLPNGLGHRGPAVHTGGQQGHVNVRYEHILQRKTISTHTIIHATIRTTTTHRERRARRTWRTPRPTDRQGRHDP